MKVSILIPVYNAENYISESIESALNQTWRNIEIIVVDDGSKDKSYEIAKRYESENVKVFTKMNSGASATRNYAFSKSEGEFIQYLDADDLLDKDKIRLQLEALQHNANSLAYCETIVFEETVDNILSIETIKNKSYDKPEDLLCDLFKYNMAILSHSYLVGREVVERVGGWNEELTRNDDAEFFSRIIATSEKVIFVNNAKVYYRNTPFSLSKQIGLDYLKSELKSLMLISELMINKYKTQYIKNVCEKRLNLFVEYFYPYHLSILKKLDVFMHKYDLNYNVLNKDLMHRLLIKIFGWRFALWIKYNYKKKFITLIK